MALSILSWQDYVKDCTKLAKKSEDAVSSNHVLRFLLDGELKFIKASVQTSMRDNSYNIERVISQKAADAMGYRFTIETGYDMYPASGTSMDFARDRGQISRAFTWELMPTGSPGFAPHLIFVAVYTPAIWKGVAAFGQALSRDLNLNVPPQQQLNGQMLFGGLGKK